MHQSQTDGSFLDAKDIAFRDELRAFFQADLGEAVPFGETGDPAFNRFATLFGLPALTLPTGMGPSGLPLGLQLIARKGEDPRLLRAALWLERLLASDDESP